MTEQLAIGGIEWQWVEGVDARLVDLASNEYVAPEMAARESFRPGAIGCALGHKRFYELFVSSGDPAALCLEDDVDLPEDLPELVEEVSGSLRGAEVALLNFHCPGVTVLSTVGAVRLRGGRLLASPVSLVGLTSGAAYVLTREAAQRLAGALVPMRAYSDEWSWFVSRGVLDGVRCVTPMPVRQSLAFRTTIDYFPPGSLRRRAREVVSGTKFERLPLLRGLVAKKRLLDFERWGATGRVELVERPPVRALGC
jgi:hypothetical protein